MPDTNVNGAEARDRNATGAVRCGEGGERTQPNRRCILRGIATGIGFVGAGVYSGSAIATQASATDAAESGRPAASDATGCILVREASCGNLTNDATIVCHSESPHVIVSSTISGEDACQTAIIETATHTPATETLDVVIATKTETPPDRACPTCIYEIEYEAFISLQECAPAMVVVHHRSIGGTTVVAREPCSE